MGLKYIKMVSKGKWATSCSGLHEIAVNINLIAQLEQRLETP